MRHDDQDLIARAFAEGAPIDRAIEKAVREALRQHKRAGNPIAEWRNGKVNWVKPEDIHVPDTE
jgi:hypothetical protein